MLTRNAQGRIASCHDGFVNARRRDEGHHGSMQFNNTTRLAAHPGRRGLALGASWDAQGGSAVV